MIYSSSSIEAEYQRLGHTLGWRFLTCPKKNIESASVALVTINPGGAEFHPPMWSVENGSAYAVESWKGCVAGQSHLQRQVLRMFQMTGVEAQAVLSGYLVPFRSRDWSGLPKKSDSINFGISLWREVFRETNVETILSFGKDVGPYMARIFRAEFHKQYSAGWGAQTIDTYIFSEKRKLIVLPHLSRFSLFGREQSEAAFRAALAG